jgi:hypothetical protein
MFADDRFRNRIEAKSVIADWRVHYNEVRPHLKSVRPPEQTKW